jgi:hypothetical protein
MIIALPNDGKGKLYHVTNLLGQTVHAYRDHAAAERSLEGQQTIRVQDEKTGAWEADLYGYVCFYNSKRIELYATSLFEAKTKAIALFKPPKSKQHMISVCLAERPDGSEVLNGFS